MNEFKEVFKTLKKMFKENSVFKLISIFSFTLFVILTLGAINCAYAAEPAYFSTVKEPLIPNCTQYPDKWTVSTGDWTNTATWNGGTLPAAGDSIKIEPAHTVTYDQVATTEYGCIGVEGELKFSTGANTEFHFTTLNVYPVGTLRIGDTTTPISDLYTATLVINDEPINTNTDPFQHGNGILALGNVYIHGRKIDNPIQSQTATILANQTSTTIETTGGITDWKAGDKILFADTRQRTIEKKYTSEPIELWTSQVETLEIATINTSTGYLTFTTGFVYKHECVQNHAQTETYCPKVANTSRNITIKSENAAGTRGHTMMTHEGAVDIRYAHFKDLGRTTIEPLDSTTIDGGMITHVGTNQIGRYPLHMHHHVGSENLTNTGYQATVVGNYVSPGLKWNISVHNSHWGLYKHNIFLGDINTGSLMITEQGNERGNEFIENYGANGGIARKRWYEPQYGGTGRPWDNGLFHDFGWEGSCLWFTGKDNIIERNFFSHCGYAGLMLNGRPDAKSNNAYPVSPNFRGAKLEDVNNPNHWTDYHLQPSPVVQSMKDNVVFAANVGLWVSFLNEVGTIESNVFIRSAQQGAYVQRNVKQRLVDNIWINDFTLSDASYKNSEITGIDLYDQSYHAGHTEIIGGVIEGFRLGIDLPGFVNAGTDPVYTVYPQETRIQNVEMKNFVNVLDRTPTKHPRSATLDGNTYATFTSTTDLGWVSSTDMDFVFQELPSYSNTRKLVTDRIVIKGYGSGPDDLELYRLKQRSDHVMETYTRAHDNCPTAGKTNAECDTLHGVMTANKIATCTDSTTYTKLDGYACDLAGAGGGGSLVVTAPVNQTIDEGGTSTITFTFTGGSGTGRTYAVNWDDGTPDETGSIADTDTSVTLSRSYADDDTHTVSIDVDDDAQNTGTDTLTVTVNNVAPSGVLNGSGTVAQNTAYTITPIVTIEPGDDTITQWLVTWGDGSPEEMIAAGNALTHTYTTTGAKTISVRATDEDGTHDFGATTVDVTCSCGQ